jgi:hypothetical protein
MIESKNHPASTKHWVVFHCQGKIWHDANDQEYSAWFDNVEKNFLVHPGQEEFRPAPWKTAA